MKIRLKNGTAGYTFSHSSVSNTEHVDTIGQQTNDRMGGVTGAKLNPTLLPTLWLVAVGSLKIGDLR